MTEVNAHQGANADNTGRYSPLGTNFTELTCAYCEGTGKDPANVGFAKLCRICKGTGRVTLGANEAHLATCPSCSGSGRKETFGFCQPCKICDGSGKIDSRKYQEATHHTGPSIHRPEF